MANDKEQYDVQNGLKKKVSSKAKNITIVVAILLSLVIVFGVMSLNFRRTYLNAKNDVIELSKKSSNQSAESIEMFFIRHEDMLFSAAELLEYRFIKEGADVPTIKNLLFTLSESYNENIYKRYTEKKFTGIYASVNGKMVHAYKEDKDLTIENYDPTKRLWYNEGIQGNGNVVFGKPYYDVYDPTIQVISATKMLSDGETVIGMDITLEDLQYAGKDLDVSLNLNGEKHNYGYGFILTEDGIVMAHKDSEEQGKRYSDDDSSMKDVFLKIKECTENKLEYQEMKIDGVNVGVFPKRLQNGWYAVTITDLGDVRTTILDYVWLNFLGTITITLLGVMYCFFLFRSYVKARKLTESLKYALFLAKIDSLTNLGNRTAYDMRIKELQSKQGTENDSPFALMMMDLNDLKYINDHYGHEAGDKYINNCCNLVNAIFSTEIFRIGGDEFALFLTGEQYNNWEKLFDTFRKSVFDANMSITPSVDKPSIAIGVAIHTAGKDDIETLQRKADAEMYTNKLSIKQARLENSEKGLATSDVKVKLLDKQILVSEIIRGLEEEQFEVWFQPQVNHENKGTLIGAEALVRWNHPTKGMIPPSVFIPALEFNGMIYELDKYVWRRTCGYVRNWLEDGMLPLPISVNVSRLDIIQPDFIQTIISYVEEFNVPNDLLHLEITESAFSEDAGMVVQVVKELIEHGFIVAIDDFGSGYSSLSLLRNVPAQLVKLDMRFFADGENQARNECILESIIRMVKMLGMGVLAEGVEKPEQAKLLLSLGCAYVQGYLYSKPLAYDDYVAYTKATVNEIVKDSKRKKQGEIDAEAVQTQKLFHNIISGTNDVIIVADINSKQLLYANRAAEEFYGKRFDPLHPTTCSKYCERGEICKNCPANGIKAGEKKEIISLRNGAHIKSLYAQIDWNGYNAFVFYQTDVSAEMREKEFASSLLNSLGVGIMVFSGDNPNELKPVFCNKEFAQLTGFNSDEVKNLLVKDCLYGVHPDDIAEARQVFIESYRSGHPMKHHLRVKKNKEKYEWVSLYANIKHLADNSFEAYMIFSDAEEEMRKIEIDNERYNTFIKRTSENGYKSLSVVHLNLTQNTCHSIYRTLKVNTRPIFDRGVDDFIQTAKNNLAKENCREEFANKFSRQTLMNDFELGVFTDEMSVPMRLTDQRIVWCTQTVNISKNPTTGDLEAVMSLNEADKDIRLKEHFKTLLDMEYEIIGNIDAETGFVAIVSEPTSRGFSYNKVGAVSYMQHLEEHMSQLVDENVLAECVRALSLDVVCDRLKENDIYTCTFRARKTIADKGTAFQWRFCFADSTKSEILFSRKELKHFFD